jgi:hypothetical protein
MGLLSQDMVGPRGLSHDMTTKFPICTASHDSQNSQDKSISVAMVEELNKSPCGRGAQKKMELENGRASNR